MNIDWSKSDDEILSFLNEDILIPNGKKLRFADIELQFPDTGYMELVATSVSMAAKVDILAQLVFNAGSSIGADLSTHKAQRKVIAIANAANWPNDLTSWILSYCAFNGPRWKHLGLPEPTLEWIREQRKQHELQQAAIDKLNAINATRNKWDSVSQSIRSKIESGLPASEVIEAVTREWGI